MTSNSGPRMTEERLRTWLDTDQSQRERLCVALLSTVEGYGNVRPRRPKGGPDGARDITATYNGTLEVWGAVGFRNSAHDSAEDKTWVKKKFESDLIAALDKNVDLKAFVFFTNVDLTPREHDGLAQFANSKGIRKLDIFYRERLRILLDSPEGLGFRFQYLGIPMSEAEQASFFGKFGTELEKMVVEGFGIVDRKLARLEFLQSCSKQLFSMKLVLGLKEAVGPEDLGHFRAALELRDFSSSSEPTPTLWLAMRDAYARATIGQSEHLLPGIRTVSWSQNPEAKIQGTTIGSLNLGQFQQLVATTGVHGKGPFKTLGDLDRKSVGLYVTRRLVERVSGVALIANNYAVLSLPFNVFRLDERLKPHFEWPEDLSDDERSEEWIRLGLRNDGSDQRVYPERRFAIDYEQYTPHRVPAE